MAITHDCPSDKQDRSFVSMVAAQGHGPRRDQGADAPLWTVYVANQRGTTVQALEESKGKVNEMSFAQQHEKGVINMNAGEGMTLDKAA